MTPTMTPTATPTMTPHGVADPTVPEPPGWTADRREALVELLVLAEHGDAVAARRLRTWLSADPVARAVSSRMAQDLASLRA